MGARLRVTGLTKQGRTSAELREWQSTGLPYFIGFKSCTVIKEISHMPGWAYGLFGPSDRIDETKDSLSKASEMAVHRTAIFNWVQILCHIKEITHTPDGYMRYLVRVTGFEPAASCSQSRRATELRYTRIPQILYTILRKMQLQVIPD